jgi:hypothetical protein
MCTFISSISKQSSEIIGAKRKNAAGELYLRECKDAKTYYRVRLLGFASKNGRTDPHITRYIHSTWQLDPTTGKKRLHKVVCPTTPWVNVEGNRASSCKICNYSNQQFSIYSDSGKTDKNACKKAFSAKKTFEAIIPVYVITDPNYEKNAGKFKVIIMTDPKEFAAFRDQIEAQQRIAKVFNGTNAVDCVIHVASETNENGYKRQFIDKIKFTTEPYDLPAINAQNIDAFPFDETFFSSPDPEEIDEYYEKFCTISNSDIPEDDDIPVYSAKSTAPAAKPAFKVPTNDAVIEKTNDVSDDDLNSLIPSIESPVSAKDPLVDDLDEIGLKPSSNTDAINTSKSDDILAELGI